MYTYAILKSNIDAKVYHNLKLHLQPLNMCRWYFSHLNRGMYVYEGTACHIIETDERKVWSISVENCCQKLDLAVMR